MMGMQPGYFYAKKKRLEQIQIFKGWVMTEKGFDGREKLDFLLYLNVLHSKHFFEPKIKVLREVGEDRTGKEVKEVKQEKD